MAHDGYKLDRNGICGLAAGILGFAGKGIQPAILGLGTVLHREARLQMSRFNILQWSFETRSDEKLLAIVAIALMVAVAASSLCLYFSRRFALDVRRKYGEHCTNRLLHLAESYARGFLLGPALVPGLVKLAKSNTIYCGRIAYLLVLAAPEAVISIAAFGALLVLEPLLTLLLNFCVTHQLLFPLSREREGISCLDTK